MANKRKKKLNNSGMSLVEVIISITILAIVVIPVLHSLTSAMVYNSKARIRQEMTLKAESIMESFKGYSLEELNTMFTPADPSNPTTAPGLAGLTGVGYTPAGPATFLDTAPAAGTAFTFGISDLTDVKGNLYKVEIKAISNGEEDVLMMDNMDAAHDAIYNAGPERTYDKEARSKAWQHFLSSNYDQDLANELISRDALDSTGNPINRSMVDSNAESYLELVDRTMTFNINTDGSGNYIVTAQMVYQYRIVDYPYYEKMSVTNPTDPYPDGTTPTIPEIGFVGEQKELTFPLSGYYQYTVDMGLPGDKLYEKAEQPERLFVYYYPQYDLNKKDIIEINNNAGIDDFSCYIIKQCAKDMNMTRIAIEENGYQAKLVAGVNADKCRIYHNFDQNIGGGSSHVLPVISGAFGKVDSFTGSADLQKKKTISYKLELTIKNAADTVVTSLNSSKIEKIKD